MATTNTLQPLKNQNQSSLMLWRVEVRQNEGIFDAHAQGLLKSINDLGINSIQKLEIILVYHIEGDLSQEQIVQIADQLLSNKITQVYSFSSDLKPSKTVSADIHEIEIAYNPGVMDPVEASTIKGVKDLGFKNVHAVHTGKKYRLWGSLSTEESEMIVNKILANKLIQHVVRYDEKAKGSVRTKEVNKFDLIVVDLLKLSDQKLKNLSGRGQLFLNLNEMKAIQKYFKAQQRNPTDCELETVAQTWSEHCYHKTFRGNIRYRYTENGKTKSKLIKNLFRSTIARATEEINKKWCVSVFHDNAGVIKFDSHDHICFKVETHNHPSALEPFGGANTGVGGVIRDTLGTGLGARPICNTDVFCFAPPDMTFQELPDGVLHPERIMQGVVSGVRDYGNKMGIPTVNGAVLFDKKFVGNPLVYCGNVGIIPKDKVKKKASKGDLIVVVGGRTGRDGIHGATFSSGELTSQSEVISSGAVQIGNPIEEKKVLDALMQARDLGLYDAITDCGAGGLSSAVGEMGQNLGVRVDLEKVPLKYHGLNYTEIWISESQERMVLAVPPKNINKLLDVFQGENVEATVIGEFTGMRRLELFYQDCQVCDMAMSFLHGGPPRVTKEAHFKTTKLNEPRILGSSDLTAKLYEVFSDYNVCSKEWIIRQYDHEVQGMSVVKPLAGVFCDGPSDASVLAPKLDSHKGIAVANGINFRYGMIDPYWMAASCIDEAVRQIVAVGGDVKRVAILDNFCWGNPDKPDRLGSLVRAAEGCYKTAVAYGVPFISGKDSLYNEYTDKGKSTAIPGTLLISSIGVIDDIRKVITMDAKKEGNLIYCVGETLDEMGGSVYLKTFGALGNSVPKINPKQAMKIFTGLHKAARQGLIAAMHDCSEGGLGVALAEMAFSGGLGVSVDLKKVPYRGEKRDDHILFSESNTRFVVEIEPRHQKRFEQILRGLPFGLIGELKKQQDFIVQGLDKNICVKASIEKIKDAWQRPLKFS